MAKLYNLARMSTPTTGTGTLTLGSAVTGFLSFAGAGISDGETVTYAISDGSGAEIGRGVYAASGTTLTRSVLKSTNGGSTLNLSGTAQVFITPAAEDFNALPNMLGAFSVALAAGTNVTANRTLTLTTGDANRAVTLASDLAFSSVGDLSPIASINSGPLAGYRNFLLNGCMRVNQRASTSNTDDTYAFDLWNILTQTGAVTIGAQANIENGWPHAMRITQAQASAQRFGCNRIMESQDCIGLRGQPVTLSARVRMSVSTTIRYAILEWTGTADAVTSDSVSDWTSSTYTASNFFIATTVTATGSTALTANTPATVSLSTTLGSSVNNVVMIFWTDSTQAQNVTLDIGKVQFEYGSTATAFERRPFALELLACERYFWKTFPYATAPASNAGSNGALAVPAFKNGVDNNRTDLIYYPAAMRATPTITFYNPGAAGSEVFDQSISASCSGTSVQNNSTTGFWVNTLGNASTIVGNLLRLHATASADL